MIDEKKLAQAIIDFGKDLAAIGLPEERICGIPTLASNADNLPLDGAVSISLNDFCVIYPNTSGFKKIRKIMVDTDRCSPEGVDIWMEDRSTPDGGYCDIFVFMIGYLQDILANPSLWLTTPVIKLLKNEP